MEHYDVIVIGSGAGGGTVAHALAPTGKRVLILERGGYLPRELENWSSKAVWGDGRYHNSGTWRDEATGEDFAPKQHYYVGGNTKFYGAVLFRMRERDFGEVIHVDGVSPAWPISYDDLEPYYGRAEDLFHVHGERTADPTEPPATAPLPHPPISDEPRIAQLRSDLEAAGLHTGWGACWDDASTYLAGEPGPGLAVAHWLVERGVALTGCDTWSYGPVPPEDPEQPFRVPQLLNVRHGVFIVENLDTAALAADGVREFALVLTHAKLRGATGAWTSPIALV
jgi:hypothetical protein